MKQELKVGDLAKVKDYSEYTDELQMLLKAANGVARIMEVNEKFRSHLKVKVKNSDEIFWFNRDNLKRIKTPKEYR